MFVNRSPADRFREDLTPVCGTICSSWFTPPTFFRTSRHRVDPRPRPKRSTWWLASASNLMSTVTVTSGVLFAPLAHGKGTRAEAKSTSGMVKHPSGRNILRDPTVTKAALSLSSFSSEVSSRARICAERAGVDEHGMARHGQHFYLCWKYRPKIYNDVVRSADTHSSEDTVYLSWLALAKKHADSHTRGINQQSSSSSSSSRSTSTRHIPPHFSPCIRAWKSGACCVGRGGTPSLPLGQLL